MTVIAAERRMAENRTPDRDPGQERALVWREPQQPRSCSFQALLGSSAWRRLPRAIRERFTGLVSGCFSGRLIKRRSTWQGDLLVQLGRLIGSPLPSGSGATDVVVSVAQNKTLSGAIWTRVYQREGFPQVINSVKRFAGPTGLEEYLGFGVVMALAVSVEQRALRFDSAGFYLARGRWRIRLPLPIEMKVLHEVSEEGPASAFAFALTIRFRNQEIIHHYAVFSELQVSTI